MAFIRREIKLYLGIVIKCAEFLTIKVLLVLLKSCVKVEGLFRLIIIRLGSWCALRKHVVRWILTNLILRNFRLIFGFLVVESLLNLKLVLHLFPLVGSFTFLLYIISFRYS